LKCYRRVGLSVLVPILLMAGCARLPCKMYTTLDPSHLQKQGSPDPPRCENFSLGQHPHVVVEGFEGAKEVALELLKDGKSVGQHSYPINSGHVDDMHQTSPPFNAGPPGPWRASPESWVVIYNIGFSVDLGVLPPGAYDLNLKTNNVLAATSHFKVTWPPDLEQEHAAIQSEQNRLEEAESKIKLLEKDIGQEKSLLDRSDATRVNEFNKKVEAYNELVAKAQADVTSFNARVEAYKARLAAYGVGGP
jgi:hypothetical protein